MTVSDSTVKCFAQLPSTTIGPNTISTQTGAAERPNANPAAWILIRVIM